MLGNSQKQIFHVWNHDVTARQLRQQAALYIRIRSGTLSFLSLRKKFTFPLYLMQPPTGSRTMQQEVRPFFHFFRETRSKSPCARKAPKRAYRVRALIFREPKSSGKCVGVQCARFNAIFLTRLTTRGRRNFRSIWTDCLSLGWCCTERKYAYSLCFSFAFIPETL